MFTEWEALMKPVTYLLLATVLCSFTACGTDPGERAVTGAGIGAAGGAVTGAMFGNPLAGAVVGGVAGGVTGAATSPRQINLDR